MSNDDNNKPGGLSALFGGSGGGLSPTHPAAQGLPSTAFSDLLGRPPVQGLYYNNKTIRLDGYSFIGCRFDNCILVALSGNFELTNCVIDPETKIEYGPEAMKIVRLFNSRANWVYEAAPSLAPRRNADGTITIDGSAHDR